MPPLINIIGKKFGRWTIISRVENNSTGHPQYLCRCDCGVEAIRTPGRLKSGNSKSCRCLQKELLSISKAVHGMSGTKVHSTWMQMIKRCIDPKNTRYSDYGGRGINVCDQWMGDFISFYKYVGDPPTPKHTLDRIDNNKGYIPGNVKWSTNKEQSNNKRTNHIIEFNGHRKTIAQWRDATGISYSALWYRIRAEWPIDKMLTVPMKG
jgi:hypothetical protein